ncbi:MAG: hypothetical protein KC656_37535, partial [Myxococcales bacterium]|nr:hypothetical protein [Myxococcales bacterium]
GGCTASTDVQDFAGGAHATSGDVTGTHSIGDQPVIGTFDPGAHTFGADFVGSGFTVGEPDDVGVVNGKYQIYAERSDGGWLAGVRIRVAGTRGVWVVMTGECDEGTATAADVLDSWYYGGLP